MSLFGCLRVHCGQVPFDICQFSCEYQNGIIRALKGTPKGILKVYILSFRHILLWEGWNIIFAVPNPFVIDTKYFVSIQLPAHKINSIEAYATILIKCLQNIIPGLTGKFHTVDLKHAFTDSDVPCWTFIAAPPSFYKWSTMSLKHMCAEKTWHLK